MCPEAQRRIEELKRFRKTVNVLTRRSFITAGLSLPLIYGLSGIFSSPSRALSQDAFLGLLLAGDCAYCNWKGLCCRRKKFGVCVSWGLKFRYRIPVGFLEANSSCEFLIEMVPIVGEAATKLVSSVCRSIPPPFHIPSKMSRLSIGSDVTRRYMRTHARWYSIPSVLRPILDILMKVKLLCPCFDLKIVDSLPILRVYEEFISKVEENIENIAGRFNTGSGALLRRVEKLRQLVEKLSSVQKYLPVFITEPVSLLWLTEWFNPDVHTVGPVVGSIVSASGLTGMATCPYLVNAVRKIGYRFPAGVDPSFICVGHWGFGYPRFGIVRHDNPLLAQLLALARFHHLFSRTFPLIEPKFDPSTQDWQIIHPKTTGCFRIGYYGVLDLYDITDLSGERLTKTLKSLSLKQMMDMVRAVTLNWDREVVVLVWERRSKCCGI